MVRSSTAINTFEMPFAAEYVKDLRISYAQNDKEIIVKTLEEVKYEGNTITVKLSQEETLAFNPKYMLEIQIKVLDQADNVALSEPIKVRVEKCFNVEVLE